jgi:tetratricopeptide (TPR) repeat protein
MRAAVKGLCALGLTALTLGLGQPVLAQTPTLDALFDRFDYPGVEREAQRLVTANASDAAGLIALARLGAQMGEARLESGVAAAERCVAAHPQNALCHSALGQVLGRKAAEAGVVGGVRLAGRVRTSFERAVELAPDSLAARIDLNTFYLVAPSIAGGGTDKARRNTEEFARLKPELADLAWAQIELNDDKLAAAQARLERMTVPEERSARRAWVSLMFAVGNEHLRQKRFEAAQRSFETGAQKLPREAEFARGLGRVAQEQKQYDRARKHFEAALALTSGPDARIYYRLAQVLEQLTQTAEALRHYERARALPSMLPRSVLKEIDERIAALRG